MKTSYPGLGKYVLIFTCLVPILCSQISFAQNMGPNEGFKLGDIIAGEKIIEGRSYFMKKEEAQREYVKEKELEEDLDLNAEEIQLMNAIKTEVNSRRICYGVNRRISFIEYNETQDPIIRTVDARANIPVSTTAGPKRFEAVRRVKAIFGIDVNKNVPESNPREITIQPGKMFYITFTPKMVEVKGRRMYSLSHGTFKWEPFTANLPYTTNGQKNGNIYYIVK